MTKLCIQPIKCYYNARKEMGKMIGEEFRERAHGSSSIEFRYIKLLKIAAKILNSKYILPSEAKDIICKAIKISRTRRKGSMQSKPDNITSLSSLPNTTSTMSQRGFRSPFTGSEIIGDKAISLIPQIALMSSSKGGAYNISQHCQEQEVGNSSTTENLHSSRHNEVANEMILVEVELEHKHKLNYGIKAVEMAIAEKVVDIEELNKRLAYMKGQLGHVQREIEIKEEIIKGLISGHRDFVQLQDPKLPTANIVNLACSNILNKCHAYTTTTFPDS
uniref:Uncharacterized protein n=1 Tax=Glossina austeni TaxID=7395 RepID=A0A1A9UI29_GLOAU